MRMLALALIVPTTLHAEPSPAPAPEASRALDFGIVFAGVPCAVSPADSGAALWVVRGVRGSQVSVTFTSLPGFLAQGAQALAVAFDSLSAAWSTTEDPATATSFDPTVGTCATIDEGSDRLYVWLGGTAVPARTTTAGDYSTAFVLDVSYARP